MLRTAILATALILIAGRAAADPCKRIPDRGPMPAELAAGRTFAGPVVYVGDGDGLCVETLPGIGGDGWVEVRLADFYAPELSEPGGRDARDALRRVALGRRVRCVVDHRTWDRVAAVCTLDGQSLGDRLRRQGQREGGRAYRPAH